MPEDLATGRQTPSILSSTRIDSAHALHEDAPPHDSDAMLVRAGEQTSKMVRALAGNDPQLLGEQIRCEANELASHLQGQQRDLDHREAEYCSRVAQIENELRVARLLLREREQELAERELQLGQRLLELEHQAVQAIACQRAAQQGGPDGDGGRFVSSPSEQASPRSPLPGGVHAAAAPAVPRADLATQKKQRALERRRRAVQKRQTAVEHLYAEVARMHRESLEMRLCTEQLWAELSGRASQPELTQRLARLRRGLADHFQLASQSLARQKDELQHLLGRLARQQKKIEVQRNELQRWAAQRQAALEEDAARLLSRQHALDRQDAEIRGLREQWEAQRREYQEEIRRLMSRLRQNTPPQTLP